MPTDIDSMTDLAKPIPISLEAVKKTTGIEKEKWKASLQKELDTLLGQKTYKATPRNGKSGLAPMMCVFTVKPTPDRRAKRRSRIVLCGNYISPFASPSTSNLDSSAFRLVVAVIVHR
eukprot:1436687-Amphidinium_carterae.1